MKNIPIILCVGTSKCVSDCIAPYIGSILKKLNVQTFVYGTQKNNVDGLNLSDYYDYIINKHKNNKIIIIDACLCTQKNLGKIWLKKGGIISCAKTQKRIGDFSLLINTFAIDSNNQLTFEKIKIIAVKIALFLKKYLSYKMQLI